MPLLKFVFKEFRNSLILVSIIGGIAGAASAIQMSLISEAANGGTESILLFIVEFIVLLITVFICKYYSQFILIKRAEIAVAALRQDLTKKILQIPLIKFEEIGASKILAVLSNDIPKLSGSLALLPHIVVSICITLGCFIYLIYLDLYTALGIIGFILLGVFCYQFLAKKGRQFFANARELQNDLYSDFDDLTNGFKELKLHKEKRDDFISNEVKDTTSSLRDTNIKAFKHFALAQNFGQSFFILLIGFLIVLISLIDTSDKGVMTSTIFIVLYLVSPVQLIVGATPALAQAGIALKAIEKLGLQLSTTETNEKDKFDGKNDFNKININNVEFEYHREDEDTPFHIGPINLEINKGEMLFIIGGNGGGKTTLAKIISGLYQPQSGDIQIDNNEVTDFDMYRDLFSAIFPDFHLFDKLHGIIGDNADEKANEFLKKLEINHKVEINDRNLSTTQLSQGQRKRLALMVSCMEERPILILDEWAADQDPHFRGFFYNELLPELKKQGKTIIAITHDDKYFDLADRVVKLDYGKMVDYQQ